MGRWECGPTAFPAVLRPGTGDVWTFDSWATSDNPVVGRLVGRVTVGVELAGPYPGRQAATPLEIDRRNLPPVTIPEADPVNDSPRSWRPGALGWVGLAGVTLLLHGLGRGALGPPPLSSVHGLATWWQQRGPLLATFAAGREILWWLGCYLLACRCAGRAGSVAAVRRADSTAVAVPPARGGDDRSGLDRGVRARRRPVRSNRAELCRQ